MLVPYNTSSVYVYNPWANIFIIAFTVLVSLWGFTEFMLEESPAIEAMLLNNWDFSSFAGHALLHSGFSHLIGNMIFLWVFGNVVCSKTGSWKYLLVYVTCIIGSAVSYLLLTDMPALGASGAVNGIVGFYLVLQPTNKVSMFCFFFFRFFTFQVSGYLVILYWAFWDIWGLFSNSGEMIGFAAHVGGLFTGIIMGCLFVIYKKVELSEYDTPTLLEHLNFLPVGYAGGYEAKHAPRKRKKEDNLPVTKLVEDPDAQESAGNKNKIMVGQHNGSKPAERKKIAFPRKKEEPAKEEVAKEEPAKEEVVNYSQEETLPGSIQLQEHNEVEEFLYRFLCPHCSQKLKVTEEFDGLKINCPACEGRILIEIPV